MGKLKIAGNPTDLSFRGKRRLRKIFDRSLCGQSDFLISDARWGRLVRDKPKLEVGDDPIHGPIIGDEGDHLHHSPALGAEQWIDLIDLPNHLGPALGRDAPELVLGHAERKRPKARLLDLPLMGIGVQPVITDHHLALVWNM
jgi:hypothetical protein